MASRGRYAYGARVHFSKQARTRRRYLLIAVLLALALAGCGASDPAGEGGDGDQREPGVFGTSAWGEATWQ